MNLTEILANLGAQAAQGVNLKGDSAGYAQMVARLAQHAGSWAAVSAAGIKCSTHFKSQRGITKCKSSAIAACTVCERATCFNHSMISPSDGNIICFGCVGKAQEGFHRASPAPAPEDSDYGNSAQCICQSIGSIDPDCPVHASEAEDFRAKCLKTLGLEEDVSWSVIHSTYRNLARKHHPDRVQSVKKKASANRRMRKINDAYTWLKNNRQEAA